MSLQILDLVADREGVDPVQLRPPLHRSVDPDALDAIVSETVTDDERSADVEFTYLGYRIAISIDDDPTLSISEREDQDGGLDRARETPELTETE